MKCPRCRKILDGIMALFGAPLAHEDHAVRACYAALRMQESVKRYADGVRKLALAEPRGMRPLVAHCHLGLGKLSRRTGQREQSQEHLTTATTMYRVMEMTYRLEQADRESKSLDESLR